MNFYDMFWNYLPGVQSAHLHQGTKAAGAENTMQVALGSYPFMFAAEK